jgi:hypothetical protein
MPDKVLKDLKIYIGGFNNGKTWRLSRRCYAWEYE